MASTDLVLAISGASGSLYSLRLLEVLLRTGRTIHLTISSAAVEVLGQETDRQVTLDQFHLPDLLGERAADARPGQVQYHHFR